MIINYYTIYDSKANEYCPPFESLNTDVAKRQLDMLKSKEGTIYNLFPDDFAIHYAYSYNTESNECFINVNITSGDDNEV